VFMKSQLSAIATAVVQRDNSLVPELGVDV
jgi:hypothetical protein